jgi:hypothetical protein
MSARKWGCSIAGKRVSRLRCPRRCVALRTRFWRADRGPAAGGARNGGARPKDDFCAVPSLRIY